MLIPSGQFPDCSGRHDVINAVFGTRWTVLILAACLDGTTRFSELQEALRVAPDMLSRRLGDLVALGLLERQPYRDPGSRGRHSYHLTPSGKKLDPVIRSAFAWAAQF